MGWQKWLLPAVLLAAGCSEPLTKLRADRAATHARAADEAFERGDFVTALASAEIAAQYDPLDPQHRDRALRCEVAALLASDQGLTADRLARAGALADALGPIDAPHAWLYETVRGYRDYGREAFDTAEAHFAAALKAAPKYVPALLGLAYARAAAKRPEDALASFRAVLEVNPQHSGALANVGKLLVELGHANEALQPLAAALNLRESSATRANLAEALAATGNTQEAIAQFRRLLHSEPRSGGAALRLGQLLIMAKDFGGAAEAFRTSFELGGGPAALRGLAEAQAGQGDLAGAEKSAARALALAPGDPSTLFLSGEIAEKSKQGLQATVFYSSYLRAAANQPGEVERAAVVKDRLTRLPPVPAPR